MTNKIKYVRDIQIIKSAENPELILIKAKGIAEITKLIAPVLVPGENKNLCEDGVYELELKFDPVESHRANLMYKAGVKNTAGLVRWAVENDFVE